MSELLTEAEAAAKAKVCERTIRRLIEAGLLPASNFGQGRKKYYRIREEDLCNVQPVQPPAAASEESRRSRRQRRRQRHANRTASGTA